MAARIEISKRLVLLNSASAVLARTINVVVIVWLHQYLLRRISPAEYQLLPLLMSLILLLPLVTAFLTAGLGRFLLTAYAQGDDRAVTQIVSTMLPLLLAAGGILLVGGLALAWHIDRVWIVAPEQLWDARLMMALLILSTAVKPPCTAFSVGFYIQQRFVLYNAIAVGGELLRVLLLFTLLFGVSTSVVWVVVANVTTELTLTLVTLVLSVRMIPALRFRRQEIRWERLRELLEFGGWSFLGNIAYRMRETFILWILNRLATPLDVAVFNVGYLGRRQVNAWTDVLTGPLYPVATGMHALGESDRVRRLYLRGGRLSLWVLLLVGLPATLYAGPIIRLYVGTAYEEAAVVMILTLAGLVITGGSAMIWQVSNATGHVRGTSLWILVTQVITVALAAYAVRPLGWGATGVTLAVVAVGIVAEALALCPLGLKLAGATFQAWTRETLLPGVAPGCLAAVVWAALGLLLRPASWLSLGLCTAAGALCYLGVLLAWCLEPRDRADLRELWARLRNLRRPRIDVPG